MITTIYIPKWVRFCIVCGIVLLVGDVALSIVQRVRALSEPVYHSRHNYHAQPPRLTEKEIYGATIRAETLLPAMPDAGEAGQPAADGDSR